MQVFLIRPARLSIMIGLLLLIVGDRGDDGHLHGISKTCCAIFEPHSLTGSGHGRRGAGNDGDI